MMRGIFVISGLIGVLCNAGGTGDQPLKGANLRIPWTFERNAGQAASGAEVIARQGGRTAEIYSDRLRFAAGRGTDFTTLMFKGARQDSAVVLEERTGGQSSYLRGRDTSRWQTGIPHYQKARVEGLYQGVDVVYYGSPENLEFDLILKAGADLSQVRMSWGGIGGVKTGPGGSILASTRSGEVRLEPPRVFQLRRDGEMKSLQAEYLMNGHEVAFRVAGREAGRDLVIDPELVLSSPMFPMEHEYSAPPGMAIDQEGNIYVLSNPNAYLGYPTTSGVLQPTPSKYSIDVALMKLTPSGDRVVFSTFIGGSNEDLIGSIAIDPSGNPVIVGTTRSRDFPVGSTAYLKGAQGGEDGFVLRLKPDGTGVVAGTYFGSQGIDTARFVAVAPDGDIWVAGEGQLDVSTTSEGPFAGLPARILRGYLARMDPSLATVRSYVRVPFELDERLRAFATDSSGLPLVGITARQGRYPVTRGAIQSTMNGRPDVYVARLEADASKVVAGTYFGGSGEEIVRAIRVGPDGSVYIAGDTTSKDFPTTQGAFGNAERLGPSGVFVAKLNESFNELGYSALISGGPGGQAEDFDLDAEGGAWLCGRVFTGSGTRTTYFPTTADAFSSFRAGDDVFIFRLAPDGKSLSYSSAFGGSRNDYGQTIRTQPGGQVLVLGTTNSPDLPVTPGAMTRIEGGNSYAFLARFEGGPTPCQFALSPSSGRLKWNAGVVEISVETAQGCAWSAMITEGNTAKIQGEARGTGPGKVRLEVESFLATAEQLEVVIGGRHASFLVEARMPRTNFRLAWPGIMSAGQSSPAVRAVAPNSIITIHGEDMSLDAETRVVTSNSLVGGRLPDGLGDFWAEGGPRRMPLLALSPTRAYAVAPHVEASLQTQVLVVEVARGSFTLPYRIQAVLAYQPAAPELFYWSRGEFSYNPVAAIHKDGGAPVGDESVIPERSRPAQPGETVLMHATGFGQTFPPIEPGEIPVRDHRAVGKVQVFLGDTELPAQSILFAGARPLSQPFEIDGLPLLNAGLNQLEIRIPDDLPDGNHLVEVIIDGYRSPSRGFITVRRP